MGYRAHKVPTILKTILPSPPWAVITVPDRPSCVPHYSSRSSVRLFVCLVRALNTKQRDAGKPTRRCANRSNVQRTAAQYVGTRPTIFLVWRQWTSKIWVSVIFSLF